MTVSDVAQRPKTPSDVPACPKCGAPMWVVHIEHDLGHDRRTYECPGCEHRTNFDIRHR
jgi:DNA-directed RNA polymerase subunit RPC12/RpoP